MGAALQIDKVCVSRRDQRGQAIAILRDLTFAARPNEVTAIVGPSGGGKSTLVRLINRLEDPSSGRILLHGEDIAGCDPLLLRRRVAMVLQKPFMFSGSVLKNLQQPLVYRGETLPVAEDPRVVEAMTLCRLPLELLERDARSLSLGQQQRVSLGRALMARPEVLLLDEPTSALDRPTADQLTETLREVCRRGGLTVLLVTHDLDLARRLADHVGFLADGRMLEEGAPGDFFDRPRCEALRLFLARPGLPGESM